MMRTAVLVLMLACAMARPPALAQRPELPLAAEILARVSSYLVGFARAYAEVVAEERYEQSMRAKRVSIGLTATERREIRSDVVSVSDSNQAWLNFRDVYAVDKTSVRDRDERLAKLFLNQNGDPLKKGRLIADEGARFNLGTISRNVNFPAMALTFLSIPNLGRSAFTVTGRAKVDGVETVELTFSETSRPTIVKSGTVDLPVLGKFWIEPATGRIMKSAIKFESNEFNAEVNVKYGYVEKLAMWLPVQMDDTCSGPRETVTGRATYVNFRKFGTSVVIK